MNRRRTMSLTALFAGLFISAGCATIRTAEVRGNEIIETRHLLPIPASRAEEGTGLALLAFEIRGVEGEGRSCRWRMINKETGKGYFIKIDSNARYALAQLDPGEYQAGRFGCGIGRVWNLDETFKNGFRVEEGTLSYLGKLHFEFSEKDLETIRHASRSDSAWAFIRATEAEGVENWPAISAFTGKPIDRSMVERGEVRDGFDVFARGISNPSTALAPLIADLKSCVQREGGVDPLRFGYLEYTALYRQGRFSEMKDRIEANGFSDRLRACVERGIMALHLPEKEREVEVRVRY